MADTPGVSVDVLVIACGNPLRGDDGVGPIVAEQVEASLSEVDRNKHRFMITHQLLPELALELAQARLAVLIDARIPQDEPVGVVRIDQVTPEKCQNCDQSCSEAETGLTHHWTLPRLLMMAEMLFGRAPQAYTVSVSAEDFDGNDKLSPAIQAAMPEMHEHVMRIINGETHA